VPTLRFGGVERVALNLATGFLGRGAAVDLVAADGTGELAREIPPGVRLVDLGAHRVLTSIPMLVRYIRRERPDAIIAMMEHCSLAALAARRLARSRTNVIATSHAHLTAARRLDRRLRVRILPLLMRTMYPSAEAVVSVSSGVADDIRAHAHGVPAVVIPNPVLPKDFGERAGARTDTPWLAPGAPPVVISAGRLAAPKDFATLIRAFALVRKQRAARLMILGEGPDRAGLERLAGTTDVGTDIALPGYVPNVFAYMKAAAAFVLSSNWEGFGLVLVEALACSAKVISTDCEWGPRDILQGGRLGELVPPGDPHAMAAAILRALDAPARPVPPETLLPYTTEHATARYAALLGPEW